MKKRLSLIIGMVVAISFTGCCIKHEFVDATCLAPRTCINCGTTEGEMIEHVWEDATCTNPKTCRFCNAIEGEALEHIFTEANYQKPATCTVCGETTGEVVVAEFVNRGVVTNDIEVLPEHNTVGKTYYYTTLCGSNDGKTIKGIAHAIDTFRFASDEKHVAKDGYEWIRVEFTLRYEGENYDPRTGVYPGIYFEDYYNPSLLDESAVDIVDEHYWHFTYTVNWEGNEYSECELFLDKGSVFDEGCGEIYLSVNICVPVGYDGSVIGFMNEAADSIYDDPDAVFVRFRPTSGAGEGVLVESEDVNVTQAESEAAPKLIPVEEIPGGVYDPNVDGAYIERIHERTGLTLSLLTYDAENEHVDRIAAAGYDVSAYEGIHLGKLDDGTWFWFYWGETEAPRTHEIGIEDSDMTDEAWDVCWAEFSGYTDEYYNLMKNGETAKVDLDGDGKITGAEVCIVGAFDNADEVCYRGFFTMAPNGEVLFEM